MFKKPRFLSACVLPMLLALLALPVAAADRATSAKDTDWPAWRGPRHTGVAPQGNPPVEWSETKNVRFKVALPGAGHSSPIVSGDRIYVLATFPLGEPTPKPAERQGSVARPSSDIWLAAQRGGSLQSEPPPPPPAPPAPPPGAPPAEPPREGRRSRPPREKPTQTYRFVVLALDRQTGNTIWQTVVREEVPHETGHETASQASASPVTDGEHVFAFFGSRGLYCLDRNGKLAWEKDLGDMRTRNEFGEGASPVLHGDTLVVNWDHEGESFIVALNKRTGEERWRAAREERTSWATPLVVEDGGKPRVIVPATNRVRAYDLATGEVVWSASGLGVNCIPSPVAAGDLVFVMSGYENPAGMALRYPGASGEIGGTERMVWRIDRGTSYVPSPLLYDGQLYFLERFKGVLSRYELATGKASYTEQRVEELGNVYASPVGAGGRVYIVDRNGAAVVLRHGPTYEVLARNKLDDTFDASPAIAGDALLLRGHENLYCLAETK